MKVVGKLVEPRPLRALTRKRVGWMWNTRTLSGSCETSRTRLERDQWDPGSFLAIDVAAAGSSSVASTPHQNWRSRNIHAHFQRV